MPAKRKPGRPSAATLAARLLGARGGRKGGPARAAALSPERRQEIARLGAAASSRLMNLPPERRRAIARKASAARWNKEPAHA